jgi:hypothetical protein
MKSQENKIVGKYETHKGEGKFVQYSAGEYEEKQANLVS